MTTLCCDVEILASCNGLILFKYMRIRHYCIFNPITKFYRLIPYPISSTNNLQGLGLAISYPSSDQYKLVTINNLVENSNMLYKFHLLSLERSSLWCVIQLRTNTFTSLPFSSTPIYCYDSVFS